MTLTTNLNDRQRQIVAQLRGEGLLSINDLCDQGLARRVHGGVAPPSNPVNLNFRAMRPHAKCMSWPVNCAPRTAILLAPRS